MTTSIACDAARRATRSAAYLFPPGFFAVVGFIGRFVAGAFFGLLAFRVTLGGAFAVFTAGFIAFAIGIAPGFEGIKISSVTSLAHIVEHLSSRSVVTHANYSMNTQEIKALRQVDCRDRLKTQYHALHTRATLTLDKAVQGAMR